MEIIVLLVLIVLNGVFALSELALVASRRARLSAAAGRGNRGAELALKLKQQPTRFLSTVQIGITSISLLNGIVGEAALAGPLATQLIEYGLDSAIAQITATIVVVVSITYVSIVIGELVPKRIAQGAPEKIATQVARPMALLAKLAAPFVWLLSASTELTLRLLGVRDRSEPAVTEEEIDALLAEGSTAGVIEADEHFMVRQVFKLDERRVGSFMVPRDQLVCLDTTVSIDDNLRRVAGTRHSQFPLIKGNTAEIVGMVHARELARTLIADGRPDLAENVMSPLFVPETLSGRELLESMRQAQSTSALVVDEYGGLQGMVTLSDLMGTISGHLHRSNGDTLLERLGPEHWSVDGMMASLELIDLLKIDHLPPSSGAYDTVGGMAMVLLDRVPKLGDVAVWRGWHFTISQLKGRRVERLDISRASGVDQISPPEHDQTP